MTSTKSKERKSSLIVFKLVIKISITIAITFAAYNIIVNNKEVINLYERCYLNGERVECDVLSSEYRP